jgi:CBS domain-containing protein
MARYRNEFNEEGDYYRRERDLRMRQEAPWGYENPGERNRREYSEDTPRTEFSRGRFGERAEYDYDEPRYTGYRGAFRDEGVSERSDSWRDYDRRPRQYARERSRLRCRDIMTRDLAVATRDTTPREIGIMMKQEDTGVIPVVEHPIGAGNGKTAAPRDEVKYENRGYGRGKLVGLITDRDIVIRAVADDKDCAVTRAEEIMTTDIYSARPNDRVVDVIRKMGEKQVRRIPVTGEDGRLLGMISMADVAVETEADQELAEAIEHISQTSSFWRRIFS